MNVYIPLVGIGYFLLAYMAIGVALFFPIALWQERFLSSYRTPNGRSFWDSWNPRKVWRGIVISILIWPFLLGYNIKTEIAYRKKGYL